MTWLFKCLKKRGAFNKDGHVCRLCHIALTGNTAEGVGWVSSLLLMLNLKLCNIPKRRDQVEGLELKKPIWVQL